MKTFILTFFSISFLTVGLSQRMVSLQVTNAVPDDNSSVPSDSTVAFGVFVHNTGSETIQPDDTLALYATIDGNAVSFDPGSTPFKTFTGNTLSPGDSLMLSTIIVLPSSQYGNSLVDVCMSVMAMNAADPLSESQITDNESCITVYVEEGLGLNELDQFAVTVYPVPASDRFWISSSEKVMGYSVVDNQGRTVTTGVDLSAGIDCSQWISGLYFIRVTSENGISTEPVTVRH